MTYADTRKRAEKGGDSFGGTAVLIPDQFKKIKIDCAGVRRFDFLPFIAKAGNPNADVGQATDERSFFVHRGIGSNSDSYCCLNKNWSKPCPVCQDAVILRRSGINEDMQLAKDLGFRHRQLFAVRDLDDKESGIQIFDYSYHLFGASLDAAIRDQDDDDSFHKYFHQSGGFSLRIGFVEKFMNGNKFYEASSINFKPRGDIPDAFLAKVPCLDDFVVQCSYEKLKAIYLQISEEEAAETSAGTKPKSKSNDDGDWESPKETKAKTARKPKADAETEPEKPKETTKPKAADDDDWEKPKGSEAPKDEPKPETSSKKKTDDEDW